MFFGSSLFFWLLAAVGAVLVPWHMQGDGLTLAGLLAFRAEDPEAASAPCPGTTHGRWWFWPVLACIGLALPGALPLGGNATRARFLLFGAGFGLLALIGQGLAIGVQGWSFPWLEARYGELGDRQFGIGLGGSMAFIGLVVLFTDGLALRGLFKGDRFVSGAVGVLVASILLFTAWPVMNVLARCSPRAGISPPAPRWWTGSPTARSGARRPHRRVNCGVSGTPSPSPPSPVRRRRCSASASPSSSPAPPSRQARHAPADGAAHHHAALRHRLGLILDLRPLRRGEPSRGSHHRPAARPLDLRLQRRVPRAGLLLHAHRLPRADRRGGGHLAHHGGSLPDTPRQPDAHLPRGDAAAHGAGPRNAWLVVFVESLADFGNPIVLGGSFGVLSTEIFFAVVGAQQDFGRAAVLAAIMLCVGLAAFLLQRAVVGRRSYVSVTGKGDVGLPTRLPRPVKITAFAIAIPWAI
jgi:hypothetical protein